MSYRPTNSVSLALSRLRGGVVIGCWALGLALIGQMLIWSLASFTEMRYADEAAHHDTAEAAPLIVTSDPQRNNRTAGPRPGRETDSVLPMPLVTDEDDAAAEARAAARPEQQIGPRERTFAALMDLCAAIGQLAMLTIVILIGVGVILTAGASVPGVEKTVSAFLWAIVLAMIVLPLGDSLALPWKGGALTDYAHVTAWVDARQDNGSTDRQVNTADSALWAADDAEPGTVARTNPEAAAAHEPHGGLIMFLARFGLMPAAAIVGAVLVGLRFCAGVEAGISRESMRLDPALEREAANIRPSSLHSGRAGSVLSRTMGNEENERQMPSATQVSAGEAPKRLI